MWRLRWAPKEGGVWTGTLLPDTIDPKASQLWLGRRRGAKAGALEAGDFMTLSPRCPMVWALQGPGP